MEKKEIEEKERMEKEIGDILIDLMHEEVLSPLAAFKLGGRLKTVLWGDAEGGT